MQVDLFDYDLPHRLIADSPARPRDSARLLDMRHDRLVDRSVLDLPGLLRPEDLLVVNDTRVIPARLDGQRGMVRIEATLHKRTGPGRWMALVRPARRLRRNDIIDFASGISARVDDRNGGEVHLDFDCSDADLMQTLHEIGRMPLPPYIRRRIDKPASDRTDYQSIFAVNDGAIAAPTASLHFTTRLLAGLDAGGIERTAVTLHVGAGTFLPVVAADTEAHVMHAEWGEVAHDAVVAIRRARRAGGRIIAIGTTSLRVLEAAARSGGLETFCGETTLFITPGYRFRVVDGLLTNFHLPRSTLMMLVSAFAGREQVLAAYDHAKQQGYRFLSYGDACLMSLVQSP